MSRGHHLTPYQHGIVKRYYGNLDTITLNKLSELVSDIAVCTDPKKIGGLWQSAHKALQKTGADGMKVGKIVAERNVEALAKLVGDLASGAIKPPERGSTPPPTQAPAPATAAPAPAPPAPPTPVPAATAPAPAPRGTPAPISHDTLKGALTAFKKRLKLSRLDEESNLGGGRQPTSSGKKSGIVAIMPPNQYPRAVWEQLASEGKIKHTGGGFYSLVE